MCIIHKGYRGKRALSPASNLVGNLISLNPAIPYEIIHSPLGSIYQRRVNLTKIELNNYEFLLTSKQIDF